MEVSGPLTPKPMKEYYFSAPTSPSHLSQFYSNVSDGSFSDDGCGCGELRSAVPFDWEEKPGTPKAYSTSNRTTNTNGDDFAFDVGRNHGSATRPADELFDGGVIKPLKPPPCFHMPPAARSIENATPSPGRSPVSQARKAIRGAVDGRRAARSLSPIRDRGITWEDDRKEQNSAIGGSGKGQKKWRLRDFFLFRSASEGRAAGKDPLRKYTAAVRQSSLESGSRGRGGVVSAHEVHYTVNRAVSENLKRKTFLPYKQGILGRLAFNPAVASLANGFGFSRK